MPSIASAPTSRLSASSSPCIHTAQRPTSSASSPMTSETPEPGVCLPAVPPVSYAEYPVALYPARLSAVDRGHPKRSPIQKYTTLAPRPLRIVDSVTKSFLPKVGESVEVTPLRSEYCAVTTGTAKTSLAALRAQMDHPLDQPALAKGSSSLTCAAYVVISALHSAASFAIPSICCLQNSAPRIFPFQTIRMRQSRRAS
jgi:hypothetical protein